MSANDPKQTCLFLRCCLIRYDALSSALGEAMRRREFIILIVGAAVAPLGANAKHGESMRRIGVLLNLAADDAEGEARVLAFAQGLKELGWSEGHNLRIDTRWATGNAADIVDTRRNWPRSRRTSS